MQVKQFYKKGYAVKNHFLIIDGDTIQFQSYDDIVCTVNDKKKSIVFSDNWNKSKTTLKNLLAFLSGHFGFPFDVIMIETIIKNQKKQEA